MPNPVKIRCALAAMVLSLPLAAALRFPDYPVKRAAEYAVKAAATGVTVGVEALEDPKDQETYFHAKLAGKGFLPVFIVIQNDSSEDSFLFDKTVLTIGETPEARSKAGEGIGIASALAISPVGIVVALKLISDASQVQENLLKREVQSRTLSPGTSMHGFLFFPVPKKGPREKLSLTIPLVRLATNEKVVLNLSF